MTKHGNNHTMIFLYYHEM